MENDDEFNPEEPPFGGQIPIPEEYTTLTEDIAHRADLLGLHANGAHMFFQGDMSLWGDRDKVKEAIRNHEATVFMMMDFRIGDLAWTDRIQNPELEVERDMFESIAPDEEDILKEAYKSKLEEGLYDSLYDDDNDEEE
jgi:hypothetical protein